ncbi:methyltransferase domain-containing protein [Nitratiruptor sp. SB155-2]|uniref:methyltransferase domain-containing protein n=1 Tax=Nitratiruptor sp. (strain SB155-2) TaxID=387092 RepID=UPI0001586FD9|nr:methyltransferase domain-containing protein [Nitratiruptor sp. SB155-2]BAF70503.1 conserved hypothetical protein [Nitratiruptor sp. SB155-2]
MDLEHLKKEIVQRAKKRKWEKIFQPLQPEESFVPKGVYTYEGLTKYSQEEFIRNAYEALLQRAPDTEGMHHYLRLLRSGKRNKTEIVSLLRYSPEGREKNVTLLGAKKRYVATLLFSVPFFGYLAKILYYLWKLPQKMSILEDVVQKSSHDLSKLQTVFEKRDEELRGFKQIVMDELNEIEGRFQNLDHAILQIDKELHKLTPIQNLPFFYSQTISFEKKNEDFYTMLEEHYYPAVLVKEKQKIYLQFLDKQTLQDKTWLDVGCGRGEFLEILRDAGIKAKGIDIHEPALRICKQKALDTEQSEAIEFLEKSKEKFGGISALQVIEHMKFEAISRFFALAYERLEKGGIILVETVNPKFCEAFNNFYIDPTHKKPVPVELAASLLAYHGFEDIRVIYSMPKALSPEKEKNYSDYALIAKKG